MSAFNQLEERVAGRKPAGLVTIPVSAFAESWAGRPDSEVCVGIRVLSERDILTARGEAIRFAIKTHPEPEALDERVETYNDVLMRFAVVYGTTDPNDVSRAADCWHGAGEEVIRDALTVEGTKFLYDAIERVTIETSPARREIDAAGMSRLIELYAVLDIMPPARASRVRRLLCFVLDELLMMAPLDE